MTRLHFLARLACWSVALLVTLRSPAGTQLLVMPLVAWHTAFAIGVSGSAVNVDLSCSGSDVIALSIAAILAYPVSWRRRLWGATLAIVWLALLNLVRVITLVQAAGSPLFNPLHSYLWPAAMIAGSAGFVVGWIWTGQRTAGGNDGFARPRRFGAVAALLIVVYVAATPWLLASEMLQRMALTLASTAAAALQQLGVNALIGGSTLVVGERAFLVTPECIVTPLMPIYLAWALTWPHGLPSRLLALAGFLPLFIVLGLLRLLTVALPAVVGPPLFVTHGFYQFVIAVLLITAAARWRAGQAGARVTLRYFGNGLLTGVVVASVVAKPYTSLVNAFSRLVAGQPTNTWAPVLPPSDVQGAISILPGFQLSLLCALAVALLGRKAPAALVVLVPAGAVAQVLTLAVAQEVGGGVAAGLPTTAVRALSLLTPLVLVLVTVALDLRGRSRARNLVGSRA